MIKNLILIFLIVLYVSTAYGEVYIAQGDVNLRADYPKFPLYQNAKIIGLVTKNTQVTLLEKKKEDK